MKQPRFLPNIVRAGSNPEIVATRNFDDAASVLESYAQGIEGHDIQIGDLNAKISRTSNLLQIFRGLVFNVLDYGAKGGGVTVDTLAIQAAYNAAKASVTAGSGGAVVWIPAGRYLTGALLFDSAFVSVVGDGDTATELITSGSGTHLVNFDAGNSPGNPAHMACRMEGIKITFASGTWTSLLHLKNLAWMVLSDLWIEGSETDVTYGLYSESSLSYTIQHSIFRYASDYCVNIEKTLTGSTAGGHAFPNSVKFLYNEVARGQKFGVRYADGTLFQMVGCQIEGNAAVSDLNHGGLFIDVADLEAGAGIAATIQDTHFESNSGVQIKLSRLGFSASRVTIERCNVLGVAGPGGPAIYGLYGDATSPDRGHVVATDCQFFNATIRDVYLANDYVGEFYRCQSMIGPSITRKCTSIPVLNNNSTSQIDLGLITYPFDDYTDNANTQVAAYYSPNKALANTVATPLRSLTGCSDGAIITLYSTNGNTTLVHRYSGSVAVDEFDCPGAANYVIPGNDSLQFIRRGGHWWPVGMPQALKDTSSPTFAGATLTGDLTVKDRIIATGSILNIRMNTSDGADDGRISINGGGSDSDRVEHGAYFDLRGNENVGPGLARIAAGNVAGGTVILATGNDIPRLTIDDDGYSHFSGALEVQNIHPKTSNGSDTGRLTIGGGGADGGDVTRGAYADFRGNENGGTGAARMVAGNVAGGTVVLATGNDVAAITIDENQDIELSGDLKSGTVGKGIYIKEGSNATMGIVTLVAGVAVVSTTKVTANSRIFLARQTIGGTLGASVDVTARTAGTSFTITSQGSILDTSTVAWWIVEPS